LGPDQHDDPQLGELKSAGSPAPQPEWQGWFGPLAFGLLLMAARKKTYGCYSVHTHKDGYWKAGRINASGGAPLRNRCGRVEWQVCLETQGGAMARLAGKAERAIDRLDAFRHVVDCQGNHCASR